MSNRYTKEFRVRVAKEAAEPANEGLEHIIAAKYNLRPNTVLKWKTIYLTHGERGLQKGRVNDEPIKTAREAALEKEVAALKEEAAILKKAAAFLADIRRE